MPVRILLADDDLLVREGLKALLDGGGIEVVAEASDGQEAVRLAESLHPDIAILDVSMPSLNGIDAARAIARIEPEVKTILVTVHSEDAYVLDAIRAGARGYVLKKQAAADLRQAIRDVCHGSVYISPGVSHTLIDAIRSKSEWPEDPLTAREREVLQLVAEGKSSKEIGGLLSIAVKTAETHRANIMTKLDIHDTAGLVRYAIRRGLVQV
jgi:DNA-binding NarL/FixJ family response regulator